MKFVNLHIELRMSSYACLEPRLAVTTAEVEGCSRADVILSVARPPRSLTTAILERRISIGCVVRAAPYSHRASPMVFFARQVGLDQTHKHDVNWMPAASLSSLTTSPLDGDNLVVSTTVLR